ncbi:hypothetical protein H3019_gp30 [Bacillus phage Karezi]|uniref:Uncharacterized protein n=1 Tax=Bacillus phage Karezi TaxID=2591398 RepID=A0A514AAP1_9CAUD|nr:hypothetical protein H3019_gp30 [Bacillus phage Karezi]QDH50350.1 hypothetical protein KAREZI_30 [Bacillus phage Karezi]
MGVIGRLSTKQFSVTLVENPNTYTIDVYDKERQKAVTSQVLSKQYHPKDFAEHKLKQVYRDYELKLSILKK